MPKIVQNHYINQNLCKIPLKLQNSRFFLKNPNFLDFRRRKFGVLCPKNLEFYVQKVPRLGSGSPQILPPEILPGTSSEGVAAFVKGYNLS